LPMSDKPLTPGELDHLEADRLPIKRVNILRLIHTLRAAWADNTQLSETITRFVAENHKLWQERDRDIVQKEVNRKTLADARRAGEEAMREECALLAEAIDKQDRERGWQTNAGELAKAIRARGEEVK
jgi:thioesterase domain-containing protein